MTNYYAVFFKNKSPYYIFARLIEWVDGTDFSHCEIVKVADDYLVTGGDLLVEGGLIDDKIFLQVVHPVAGVIKEFISGFRIASDTIKQLNLQLHYPAKIPAGLSLRCKYIASADGALRKIAVNFYLHKVLE